MTTYRDDDEKLIRIGYTSLMCLGLVQITFTIFYFKNTHFL